MFTLSLFVVTKGDIPEEDLSEEEKIATRLTHELLSCHRVNDELYHEAEQAFGTKGLFDLIALIGEYQTVCAKSLAQQTAGGAF